MSIGQRIRQFRIQKGLSIEELARRAGLSPSVISNIERFPGYELKVSSLQKIAWALGVPLEQLVPAGEEPGMVPDSLRGLAQILVEHLPAEVPVYQAEDVFLGRDVLPAGREFLPAPGEGELIGVRVGDHIYIVERGEDVGVGDWAAVVREGRLLVGRLIRTQEGLALQNGGQVQPLLQSDRVLGRIIRKIRELS